MAICKMNDLKSRSQNSWVSFAFALTLAFCSFGCEKKTAQRLRVVEESTTSAIRVRPCNVLLIGLDSLADPMQRQWAARHETPLTITKVGRAEFEESKMDVANDINVLVYPADMMVDLIANKKIDPLDNDFYDSDQFSKFSLLKHCRKAVMRFDGKPFGATCGGPMFVQIYRDDILKGADQAVPLSLIHI